MMGLMIVRMKVFVIIQWIILLTPFITISTNHVGATVGTAITPVTIVNTNVAATYYSISPAISNGLFLFKK
jgi:hypothetical protein